MNADRERVAKWLRAFDVSDDPPRNDDYDDLAPKHQEGYLMAADDLLVLLADAEPVGIVMDSHAGLMDGEMVVESVVHGSTRLEKGDKLYRHPPAREEEAEPVGCTTEEMASRGFGEFVVPKKDYHSRYNVPLYRRPPAREVDLDRIALALDYIGVNPLEVAIRLRGEGSGGLNDRRMIWGLPDDHHLALSPKLKQRFKDAALALITYAEAVRDGEPTPEQEREREAMERDHEAMERLRRPGWWMYDGRLNFVLDRVAEAQKNYTFYRDNPYWHRDPADAILGRKEG